MIRRISHNTRRNMQMITDTHGKTRHIPLDTNRPARPKTTFTGRHITVKNAIR